MTFERAIPVLPSLDLDATLGFYADKLGFSRVAAYPDYAVVERDGVQVHFWLTDDPAIPRNMSCRIDVAPASIDALYAELEPHGVVHPNAPLRDTEWGTREFAVLDGDGNAIHFSERR